MFNVRLNEQSQLTQQAIVASKIKDSDANKNRQQDLMIFFFILVL
jgi:hypothetical protein